MGKTKYLVETHAHTSEVSACSNLSAAQQVRMHKDAGYDALVITDHYLEGETETAAQRRRFARGYELAKAEGDRIGLVVLPGMELRFDDGGYEDYLVYLPDPALYLTLKGLTRLGLRDFHKKAADWGLLVYQAHPFRSYLQVAPAEYLDGVEVHNGNPHHDSHNDQALAFARRHGLRQLSGGDVHETYGLGLGGIYVPKSALTPAGFVAYLRDTPKPEFYVPNTRESGEKI